MCEKEVNLKLSFTGGSTAGVLRDHHTQQRKENKGAAQGCCWARKIDGGSFGGHFLKRSSRRIFGLGIHGPSITGPCDHCSHKRIYAETVSKTG